MTSRSYTPRHAVAPVQRDPDRGAARTATAVVTTVGAAALATAAMAATATSADAAAKYAVWNRVASCESSNNWHINTGNGYYGGLQFSAGTWGAYGGHRYASEASGATRLEQIEVARRVLNSQGPNAWPVCGPRAGLSRSNGHATGRALPANPRRAEGVSAHAARHRHHAGTHAHHRSHHARHATAGHVRYRVRSGDTLAKIAARHHVAGGWHHLYRLNRGRIANPNVLYVGQIILLP